MSLAMQKRNNVCIEVDFVFLVVVVEIKSLYTKNGILFYVLYTQIRLPPEVNRVLYIRNLPYKITSDEMYDIFGKYGAIRQIRV